MAKKNIRSSTNQLRSRTTRSSKPRLLTDPTSSTQLLTTQLQSLGLYAAHTIGDGNCLFRALSDQVHGSPEKHRQVRKQICDWIEQHKESYEGFVEDDDYLVDDLRGKRGGSGSRDKGKGLEAHLRCMRENATYGGHMELSAFAHLTKRNIKVIQPGLVYVIEWNAGESSQTSTIPTSTSSSSSKSQDQDHHQEPRRSKRTQRTSVSSSSAPKQSDENKQIVKIGTGKHGYYVYEEVSDSDDDNNEHEVQDSLMQNQHDDQGGEGTSGSETVYVAYHDWEHFSSIRNLRGPHAGLPHVKETPVQSVLAQREHEKEDLKEREREKKRKDKEREREVKKTKVTKVKLKIPSPSGSAAISTPQPIAISTSLSSLSSCSSLTSIGSTTASTNTTVTPDPTLIPLPNSRSVSPFPPIPFSSTSATAQSNINTRNITDSTSMSTSPSTSTSTPLPHISIPTISPPIPATPTSPTSTPVLSVNTIHSSHSHLHQHLHQHQHRSPKRTFDESSASGEDGDGGSGGSTGGSGCSGREKRTRVGSVGGGRSRLGTGFGGDADADNMDVDRDTPGLSAPGSSISSSSSAMSPDSSSDLTSPSPPPQQILVEPDTASTPPHSQSKSPKSKKGVKFSYGINNSSKPLTRRQRKALGLPKARTSLSSNQSTTSAGAGKIIIPGGKWRGRQTAVSVVEGGDGGDEEWRRNGTGRVDVRGFRELKI